MLFHIVKLNYSNMSSECILLFYKINIGLTDTTKQIILPTTKDLGEKFYFKPQSYNVYLTVYSYMKNTTHKYVCLLDMNLRRHHHTLIIDT